MNELDENIFILPCDFFAGLAVFAVTNGNDELLDTKEGDDLNLRCRFTEKYSSKEFVLSWYKYTAFKPYDNVAYNDDPLNTNYRWVFFFFYIL